MVTMSANNDGNSVTYDYVRRVVDVKDEEELLEIEEIKKSKENGVKPKIFKKSEFMLIDLRNPDQIAVTFELKYSKNIQLQEILDEIFHPEKKNVTYIFFDYDDATNNAETACEIFHQRGYINSKFYKGGCVDWIQQEIHKYKINLENNLVVDFEEVFNDIEDTEDVFIIDVRQTKQLKLGFIPNSINFPHDSIIKYITLTDVEFEKNYFRKKPKPYSSKIIFYGYTCEEAVTSRQKLVKYGYRNCVCYLDGWLNWQKELLPKIRSQHNNGRFVDYRNVLELFYSTGVTLIDVRSIVEVKSNGHLEGSLTILDYKSIEYYLEQSDTKLKNRSKTIVFISNLCYRANKAVDIAEKLGYNNCKCYPEGYIKFRENELNYEKFRMDKLSERQFKQLHIA